MQKMYFVQRGTVKKRSYDLRLTEAVDMDYMGNSNFEFGALPKSLRRAQASIKEGKVWIKREVDAEYRKNGFEFPSMYSTQKCTVFVVSYLTDEDFVPYAERMKMAFQDMVHLEESLYPHRADFWWDIQNEVFFTTDKVAAKRLPSWLVNSWNYMDQQAALRAQQQQQEN